MFVSQFENGIKEFESIVQSISELSFVQGTTFESRNEGAFTVYFEIFCVVWYGAVRMTFAMKCLKHFVWKKNIKFWSAKTKIYWTIDCLFSYSLGLYLCSSRIISCEQCPRRFPWSYRSFNERRWWRWWLGWRLLIFGTISLLRYCLLVNRAIILSSIDVWVTELINQIWLMCC